MSGLRARSDIGKNGPAGIPGVDRKRANVIVISFETKDLRLICSSLRAAEKALGASDAQALIATVADIEAMETADELLVLFGASARILGDNSIEVAIGAQYRATFVPAGTRFRPAGDGAPDWATVGRLKLTDLSKQP